jgi:WD40 repeat protein
MQNLDCHNHWILGLAITSDSKYFVTGSRDKTINIWETVRANNIRKFISPNEIHTLILCDDDTSIVTGDYEGSIIFYDFKTGIIK